MLIPLRRGERVTNVEYRYKAKNGSYVYLESNYTPVLDPQGKLVSYLAVSRDITAWKYFGPRRAENDAGSHEYVSLQIWEWRGIKHRFNIVCGTPADGERVFQTMKRYQPRGMIF